MSQRKTGLHPFSGKYILVKTMGRLVKLTHHPAFQGSYSDNILLPIFKIFKLVRTATVKKKCDQLPLYCLFY